MIANRQIYHLFKGRFYKPKMTKLSKLPLDTFQIVKDLFEQIINWRNCLKNIITFNTISYEQRKHN